MKRPIHILLFFILLLSGCSNPSLVEQNELAADQGIINLQTYEFYEDKLISLDGQWAFHWQQLLTPTEAQQHKTFEYIEVPNAWNVQTGTMLGYATYSLTIQIPKSLQGQVMGIYIPHQYSSYSLWADGERIAANGRVGETKESSKPAFRKELAYFSPDSPEIKLTMQVSNFEFPIGGATRPILFGTADAISTHYTELIASTLFVIGGILVMGIYQLGIFIFRRQERAFLYFGMVSIMIAARALFVEPLFFTVLFPDFSWIWQSRLEHLILYIGYMMFLLFLRYLYPNEMSRGVVKWSIVLSVILLVITAIVPPLIYRPLFNYFLVIAFATMMYVLYVLIQAVRRKRPTAVVNLTASILFFVTTINDAFISLNWIDGMHLATYGFFMYILIQSINLSRNYARKFQESESLTDELRDLNLTLDEKIHARTKQLEVMNEKLHELTLLDGLTGLNNRRFFDEKMVEKAEKVKRTKDPMTLLLIDLDDFKKYNDTYGHVLGDELIKFAAAIFKKVVDSRGYIARYGGEEFAIILPDCTEEKGYMLAEEIRMAMENAQTKHLESSASEVATLSIGGTSSSRHPHQCPEDWIKLADRALYESKEKGRNCVTMK
ncbi:diguanylate cyclase [Paenisporosarcina sp. NPDC076898]|uniref:diguanylate cyclase n=1 Tax=unclassified Paenisporosarcina TaxID=2642018 RepID=UPI003D0916CC